VTLILNGVLEPIVDLDVEFIAMKLGVTFVDEVTDVTFIEGFNVVRFDGAVEDGIAALKVFELVKGITVDASGVVVVTLNLETVVCLTVTSLIVAAGVVVTTVDLVLVDVVGAKVVVGGTENIRLG
jgi:hypothetical protein